MLLSCGVVVTLCTGIDAEKYTYMIFNFSAQTSANMTQDILDSKLDKRKKGVYGPPTGKRMMIFMDDLNMPQVQPLTRWAWCSNAAVLSTLLRFTLWSFCDHGVEHSRPCSVSSACCHVCCL